MAIQTLRVRVCDICKESEGVTRYRLTRAEGESRSVSVDLCSNHAAAIEELIEKAPIRRKVRRKVTPMTEVVAKKATTKRAARKRT